jgi:putative (di)nucleoside polyphosphate hydrolase
MKDTKTIETRFFRAGVGTVIYNTSGEVVLFERTQNPVGMWQFQQGGIDLGEQPTDTLWRELMEEVDLTPDDFDDVHNYPHWTVYQPDDTLNNPGKSRIGHTHRWFFLRLKDNVTINLDKATMVEASAYKWITFDQVLTETEECRQYVYQALQTYFQTNVLKSEQQ